MSGDKTQWWLTLKWRLLLCIRSPRLSLMRVWHGPKFFNQVPLSEIAGIAGIDGVIVEAGAADGADTVQLATLVPEGRVYAFEPFQEMFSRLKIKTQGLGNVTCEQLALASTAGPAKFYSSYQGTEGGDSGSILKPDLHESLYPEIQFHESESVCCVVLDEYFAARGEELPRFAWLDLQGMEIAVLESSPLVRESLSAVWMEVFRVRLYDKAPTYKTVVETMKNWGFHVAVDRVGATAGNILFVRSRLNLG